jgi:hypothetical protein
MNNHPAMVCPACKAPYAATDLTCQYCGAQIRSQTIAEVAAGGLGQATNAASNVSPFAVVATVCALIPCIGMPLGLLFVYLARKQIRQEGKSGNGFITIATVLRFIPTSWLYFMFRAW